MTRIQEEQRVHAERELELMEGNMMQEEDNHSRARMELERQQEAERVQLAEEARIARARQLEENNRIAAQRLAEEESSEGEEAYRWFAAQELEKKAAVLGKKASEHIFQKARQKWRLEQVAEAKAKGRAPIFDDAAAIAHFVGLHKAAVNEATVARAAADEARSAYQVFADNRDRRAADRDRRAEIADRDRRAADRADEARAAAVPCDKVRGCSCLMM